MPPPTRRRGATPRFSPALDRVVARCLAKNPADRFASCDELASALYPLARASAQAAAPKIKRRSWWSRPTRPQDVVLMAAACLFAGAKLSGNPFRRAGLVVPPPPEAVRFAAAVPLDALIHTTQTVTEAPSSEIADGASPGIDGKESSTKPSRSAKHPQSHQKPALSLRRAPAKAVVAALPASPALKEPAAPAASGLQIEVTSAVTEGTLTVFADRQLLFSVDLATEKKGQPLHLRMRFPRDRTNSE